MGKKQHQKDKLYLTTTEWKEQYGGHKEVPKSQANFRRLPFDHCAHLNIRCVRRKGVQPGDRTEGHVFDITHIVPYVKKFGKNPITGEKLDAKSLIKLNIFKNAAGEYHCPVTFRTFSNNSHIVAIKTTGNVYAYEAVDELNLKAKYFKDLLTDAPFTKKDIITIQDPKNLEKFNIATFDHVKKQMKVVEEDLNEKQRPEYYLKCVNPETRDTLAQLKREYKPPGGVDIDKLQSPNFQKNDGVDTAVLDPLSAANYTTGRVAASFTSTAMDPITKSIAAVIDEDVLRYERVTKLGYVRLITNLGEINLELNCDLVPKTCENFIKLCQKGYYNGTTFHRSIKHFMIQGGDPTGTGSGGESIWGGTFKDEFKAKLHHSGRGVLSMANSGPDTNKSQFFITYRSCKHLDRKHTIFGRVVGGMDTLGEMEKVETDHKDRPKTEIKIIEAQVFVDPFEEADAQLAKDREEKKSKPQPRSSATSWPEKDKCEDIPQPKAFKSGVGKYIRPDLPSTSKRVDPTHNNSRPCCKEEEIDIDGRL